MRPMHVALGALVYLATAALPATAQERNPLLVAAEPGRFVIPLCQLEIRGKARDGQRELRKGIEESEAEKRAEALGKAEDILTAAVAGNDARNPSAWYHLARTYLALGDVAGADSAFAKVVQMVPDCEVDINQYRQAAWTTLATAGLELRQRGKSREAMKEFRDATRIYRGLPHVFENMGVLFANADMHDSAAIYFGKALDVSEHDERLVENRNSSALNRALMLRRLGRHEEAVQLLDRYLIWNPSDVDARRSKANSLRELGREAEAEAVERELVAQLAAMDLDSLPMADLIALGVTYYDNDDFAQAATVFEHAMERSPWSRDAVYNLAHTLAMVVAAASDSAEAAQVDDAKRRLTEVGRRLLAFEPLNEDSYRLPAQGYRDRDQDSLVLMAERLMALPVDIQVTQFALHSSGALWTAIATGRTAANPAGEPLPSAPLTLIFEFVDDSGQVVHSEELDLPALELGTTQELRVEAEGSTIASWRYRRK